MRIIIFDMDDTLYPENQFVDSGFKAVDEFLKQQNVNGFYTNAIGLFYEGRRGAIFNEVLDDIGFVYDNEFIQNLIGIYRSHIPDIQLFPDSRYILDYLYEKYPLGLISDGYLIAQKNKVSALGISRYFEKIILTDELGREFWKPNITSYRMMENHFKTDGKNFIYIGDNIAKDFVTANKLGWTTIQIKRPNGEYDNVEAPLENHAKYKIENLKEIINILK